MKCILRTRSWDMARLLGAVVSLPGDESYALAPFFVSLWSGHLHHQAIVSQHIGIHQLTRVMWPL